MITLHNASMLDWLAAYDGPLFDSCVTDPPYHLTSIVKRFGKEGAAEAKVGTKANATGAYARASKGFMGKEWDGGDLAFRPETWRLVFDALKPGAHLVAFSGTRTYHRMACAIEDAGFEIRDQLAWAYGSGFPKSHNIGGGWGTALKPAWEPICLARKPLAEKSIAANVLAHGAGAINVDGCRVEGESTQRHTFKVMTSKGANGGAYANTAHEYAARDEKLSTGSSLGRWPANLCHDGSDEVLAGFPEAGAGGAASGPSLRGENKSVARGKFNGLAADQAPAFHADSGSAARFFYSAKAGPLDRIGTAHATVKPVDLMRWLCRLVTPPSGHILEPFAGSGTTGIAAMAEGFDCTMIELEADHAADIARKLAFLRGEGGASVIEKHRARIDRVKAQSDGPLFGAG